MDRGTSFAPGSAPLPTQIVGAEEAESLEFGDLSEFFNPFLPHFVREALRGGGEVWVSRKTTPVDGLLLYNAVEKVGTIFTRDGLVAETLFALKDGAALFSEFSLGIKPETYYIYATGPPGNPNAHRFSHPVRVAMGSERAMIARMLSEMYGRIDTSWLQASPRGGDRCFVVEISGEIAGAAWVSVVGAVGRLHSLSVRPRYRRLGIGTDLWHARVLWAGHVGARRVISEISKHNAASLAIARAGGMVPIGRMFLSHRPGTEPSGPQTSGAPQLGHVLSVTSTRAPQ